MKAIVQTQYGSPDVLRMADVQKPVPADNEVLVKIHATTVTATEAVFRQGKPYFSRLFTGLSKPKHPTLGEELAGEVVAIGKDVTAFTTGDQVFGTAGPDFGAAAEYIAIPEDEVLVSKPSNLSYAEAAASVDGFLTALPFLRDGTNHRSAPLCGYRPQKGQCRHQCDGVVNTLRRNENEPDTYCRYRSRVSHRHWARGRPEQCLTWHRPQHRICRSPEPNRPSTPYLNMWQCLAVATQSL